MDRIERIMELLKISPEDNFLQHALALENIKLGRDSQARNLFEEILNRDPGYIGSYYHLGKLLERNAEPQLALAWYERGIEAAKNAGDQHALQELQAAHEELAD
mgnify:CR=1 FL=1